MSIATGIDGAVAQRQKWRSLTEVNSMAVARPVHKIRSRAPLRLGLAGGGTDVSPYSDDFGGAILNMTVDRYAFAFIEPSLDWKIKFIAADLGIEESFPLDMEAIATARLQLHAGVYRRMVEEFGGGRPLAITVRTSVDAPAGSGLGSSSALVIALVEAFRALLDVPLGLYEVAHLAFEIERIDLGLAGGKQDHYAAAFGGINFIEFMADDRVIVNPLRVPRPVLCELEASLLTCFSGVSRRSGEIIDQQRLGMSEKRVGTIESLHRLKSDALEMKQALLTGNIERMAKVLERSWEAKKETALGVTTPQIEILHRSAIDAGAMAGKVSGAGGGGFIMFMVPPERRLKVIRALNEAGGAGRRRSFDSERGRIMGTSEQEFIAAFLDASARALHAFVDGEAGHKAIIEFANAITGAISAGGKVMLAGNGGSAADAQHIAAEFASRLFFDRAPLPAIALTTDSSVLTAVGNDYGFDKVFERQILGLGTVGDVFLGISTSGRSPNVLNALNAARSRGIVTLGFTGNTVGPMADLCDHLLCAPSEQTAIIQQIHIVAAHLICGLVENRICGPKAVVRTVK